jgi:uncharacterized phage protein (TIGR01671 family)
MREIKFRAWHILDKEIVYFEDWESIRNLARYAEYNYVDNIMQYTGLKDSNGKEIYEGDILSEKWKVEVYKDNYTGAYMIKFHNNPEFNKPKILYSYLKQRERAGTDDRDSVVIGNIYENPELLENETTNP